MHSFSYFSVLWSEHKWLELPANLTSALHVFGKRNHQFFIVAYMRFRHHQRDAVRRSNETAKHSKRLHRSQIHICNSVNPNEWIHWESECMNEREGKRAQRRVKGVAKDERWLNDVKTSTISSSAVVGAISPMHRNQNRTEPSKRLWHICVHMVQCVCVCVHGAVWSNVPKVRSTIVQWNCARGARSSLLVLANRTHKNGKISHVDFSRINLFSCIAGTRICSNCRQRSQTFRCE